MPLKIDFLTRKSVRTVAGSLKYNFLNFTKFDEEDERNYRIFQENYIIIICGDLGMLIPLNPDKGSFRGFAVREGKKANEDVTKGYVDGTVLKPVVA